MNSGEAAYEGMACHDCDRGFDEVIDFLVADPIWNYVMGDEKQTTYTIREGLFDQRLMARSEGVGGVVCLACFDKRARALGIEYRESVLVFGVECWMGGHYNDGVPLVAPIAREQQKDVEIERVRVETVQAVMDLMEDAGTLRDRKVGAITPNSNGYSCWFIPDDEEELLTTAALSAEDIVARIDGR